MTKLKEIKITNRLLIFIVSIFLGILMAFQAKTVQSVPDLNTPYSRGNNKLSADIKKLKEENRHLDNEIRRINRAVKKHEKKVIKDKETDEIFNEIQNYRMMCGFEDIQGSGIIIEIYDLYDDYYYNYDPQVLNDKKEILFTTINLLRIGNAEAISVNDIRITNYTEMELANNHFEINGKSTNTPFVIKAMGDKDHLYNIVKNLGEDCFFGINITKEEQILMPKNNKAIEFKYANPLEESSK
ncbi:DUF881 domain-containing protein [Anaerosalibacter sp. Marseille-P3206]|uniref:DUF881 domain-containing protein n=1 Tax=Anaerosalibacter sp. Marseille-P3206 TaxID=1871005 RepID=UPI000986506A|nr:DUF881 domain-containing protein [Anaerosalibacter sp. Marseille-P3206]